MTPRAPWLRVDLAGLTTAAAITGAALKLALRVGVGSEVVGGGPPSGAGAPPSSQQSKAATMGVNRPGGDGGVLSWKDGMSWQRDSGGIRRR